MTGPIEWGNSEALLQDQLRPNPLPPRQQEAGGLMVYTVCKEFTFHAAHQLPLHDGQCRDLHGHTYRVAVEASAALTREGPQSGMVVDFAEIKKVYVREIEPLVEHKFLNDTLPIPHTTAELIAGWILEVYYDHLTLAAVRGVTVWETPTSWARATL